MVVVFSSCAVLLLLLPSLSLYIVSTSFLLQWKIFCSHPHFSTASTFVLLLSACNHKDLQHKWQDPIYASSFLAKLQDVTSSLWSRPFFSSLRWLIEICNPRVSAATTRNLVSLIFFFPWCFFRSSFSPSLARLKWRRGKRSAPCQIRHPDVILPLLEKKTEWCRKTYNRETKGLWCSICSRIRDCYCRNCSSVHYCQSRSTSEKTSVSVVGGGEEKREQRAKRKEKSAEPNCRLPHL